MGPCCRRLVFFALIVGGGDAFLTGGRHALARHTLLPACPASPSRRHAWARCVLAGRAEGKACTDSQVAVEPASEHMFGSLAQLRVGELSRNFPDISQREAELMEMTKVASGTMCLVATVPADSPCAAGLPSQEIPGAANILEMRELGWMTEEAAAERLEELQREWERELAAGEHRVVVGAVDVQELNEAAFWEKPAWKSRQDDDASLYYICNMVVREQARRVGIGRKLLKAALEHARAADAQIVCLQVRHNNESAQQLYRTAGFCETDRETSEHILRCQHRTSSVSHLSVCLLSCRIPYVSAAAVARSGLRAVFVLWQTDQSHGGDDRRLPVFPPHLPLATRSREPDHNEKMNLFPCFLSCPSSPPFEK